MLYLGRFPALLGLSIVLSGCDLPTEPGAKLETPDTVGPEETFNWDGQPISFTPPGDGWKSDRSQNGGEEGVGFIKSGGLGTGLSVVEILAVRSRDKCGELTTLRDTNLREAKEREVVRGLQTAELFTVPLYYPGEEKLAKRANSSIESARHAYKLRDYSRFKTALNNALGHARRIKYTIDHCSAIIDKDRSEKAGRPEAKLTQPASIVVGGLPAVVFGYSFYEDWRKVTFYGREVYVVANNHLFKISYITPKDDFALLESVVGSIKFPPGVCSH